MISLPVTSPFRKKFLRGYRTVTVWHIGVLYSCVAVFCALIITTKAQAQYRIDHWTADMGLPQNSVHDILQTRDGYLWLTTLDGLVRFDGFRFTVFNKSNSPGISSNRFLSLREDKQGDLWIGTEDGGVVRYHQGSFSSYGKEQGLENLHAVSLFTDDDGNLLVLLFGGYMLRWSGDKFLSVDPATFSQTSKQVGTPENWRVTCNQAENGIQGILCLTLRSVVPLTKADGLPGLNLAGGNAVETRDGVLWVGLANIGLAKIENHKVTKVYTERDGLPGSPILLLSGAHVSLISKDKQNSFWLTNVETWQHQLIGKQVPTSISDLDSSMAYEDREGNLWFGALRDGLLRARKQSVTPYSKPDGLTQNNIYPIYEDRTGVIRIGSTEGFYSYRDGTFTAEESLQKKSISAIGEDQSGRLLIGETNKVWVWDGKRFVLFYEIDFGVFWAIHSDPDGSLWFGTDKGLLKLKDGRTTLYTTRDGLAGDDVKVIIDDSEGGLWIGSYGGLTHYRDGKFTRWTESDGLPSRTIRSLYQDNDRVLWIGTYDGGLGRFKDGKFTRYTINEGLFNNGVFQILEDGHGNFWMSSNRGIYRVNRQELNEFAEGGRTSITSIAGNEQKVMLFEK